MSHHTKPVKPEAPRDKFFVSYHQPDQGYSTTLRPSALGRSLDRQPFLGRLDVLTTVPRPYSNAQDYQKTCDEILEPCKGCTYSHARLNPSFLLTPLFMNTYVREGSLVLISVNEAGSDVLSIDGGGHMVLNVSNDTYGSLGLTGKQARNGPPRDRYIITVDLREASMRDGKAGYERLKKALHTLGELDLLATYVDKEGHPQAISWPNEIVPPKQFSYAIRHCLEDSYAVLLLRLEMLSDVGVLIRSSNARKRKRRKGEPDQEEDFEIFQESLQAIAYAESSHVSHEDLPDLENSDGFIVHTIIEGLIHPNVVKSFVMRAWRFQNGEVTSGTTGAATDSCITAHAMPHSPLYSPVKRHTSQVQGNGHVLRKTSVADDRPVESATPDGYTVILYGGRVVVVNSAT